MHSSLGRRGVHPRDIERQPRVWKEAPTAAELLSSSLKSRHCPEMKVHAGHERTDEDAAEHARVVQLQGSGLARELQQRHGQWASPSHSVQSSGQGTSPRYFRNGNQRPPLLRPTQTAVYIETGQKDSFGGGVVRRTLPPKSRATNCCGHSQSSHPSPPHQFSRHPTQICVRLY